MRPTKGFAPVIPVQMLGPLHFDYCKAGPYHLPLAHDVLKKPNQYHKVFDSIRGAYGDDRTIIMDNSVIETGLPFDPIKCIEACEITQATHLVLPDVLQDGMATLAATVRAYEGVPWNNYKPVSFAVAPQGRDMAEWIACAEQLYERVKFSLWCIPRNVERRLCSRWNAANILRTIDPFRPIHLLGFSDWIWHDMLAARHPNVIGIDSAVPIRMGDQGDPIRLSSNPGERGDWWDTRMDIYEVLHPQIIANLDRVRSWINIPDRDEKVSMRDYRFD